MDRQRTKCGHNYFLLQALRGWSRLDHCLCSRRTLLLRSAVMSILSLLLNKDQKNVGLSVGTSQIRRYLPVYASKYTAKKASLTFLSENVP